MLPNKYRPEKFSEVIGNPTIIKIIQNMFKRFGLKRPIILHSNLPGVGKTSLARITAKLLICENVKDSEPCNNCAQCNYISQAVHNDVLEVDGAVYRRIDDVRRLLETARHAPELAKKKVYIIDEAHMLTTEAQNALLRMLEEGPKDIHFILCTTQLEGIKDTIKSRSDVLHVKGSPQKHIKKLLQRIVDEEDLKIEDEILDGIIANTQGQVRDAIGLLEFVTNISVEEAAIYVGYIPKSIIRRWTNILLYGSYLERFKTTQEMINAPYSIETILKEIQKHIIFYRALINHENNEFIQNFELSFVDNILELIYKLKQLNNSRILFEVHLPNLSRKSLFDISIFVKDAVKYNINLLKLLKKRKLDDVLYDRRVFDMQMNFEDLFERIKGILADNPQGIFDNIEYVKVEQNGILFKTKKGKYTEISVTGMEFEEAQFVLLYPGAVEALLDHRHCTAKELVSLHLILPAREHRRRAPEAP